MSAGKMMRWMRDADKRLSRTISNRRRILVNSRTPMNFAVMAPIYNAMRDDPRVEFYFTASEQPAQIRTIYRETNPDLKVITPKRALLTRFDAYLVADVLWMALPRGTPRILMFHGVAGNYSHIYDTPESSMREWDRLFFINRRRMKNFVRSGAIAENSTAARLIGYPKLDCLVDGSLMRDEILTGLGIDPDRRTVLYAPTWSPYSSLNSMGEQLVRELCFAGYAVIVKLHDRSRDSQYIHSGGVDWISRLEPILRQSGGCIAEGSDASPYLAASDILITDHSSVGFEYLLLDRPLIRIEMPELIAKTNIPADYVQMISDASFTIRESTEVVAAVDRAFGDPARLSEARQKIAEDLFYDPGNATARAVLELYRLIEIDPMPTFRLPSLLPQPGQNVLQNP
jgi:hypothetical protein